MSAVVLAERLGYMPIVGGNDATMMTDTDEVIDRLVADIDAAKRNVHLLYYIFANDATGRRVADLKKLMVGNSVSWDLTNDDGDRVATGAYIVIFDMAGRLVRAKLFVIAGAP